MSFDEIVDPARNSRSHILAVFLIVENRASVLVHRYLSCNAFSRVFILLSFACFRFPAVQEYACEGDFVAVYATARDPCVCMTFLLLQLVCFHIYGVVFMFLQLGVFLGLCV